MNLTSPDLEGLMFESNNDGTYTGTKEVRLYDKTTGMTYNSYLEYPRLLVKWENGIEYSTAEIITVLPVIKEDKNKAKDTLWDILVPDENVKDCDNCANYNEPDEVDNGCYKCSKGYENNFEAIDTLVDYYKLR
jgi:hypothetical protein